MMKFEDIWAEFSWVVDELNSGMAFFEGYLPAIRTSDIELNLLSIAEIDSVICDCEPCWNHASDIPAVEQDYSISECTGFYYSGKLSGLDFWYDRHYGWITSHQKLMFGPLNSETDVTIICFADWILGSANPKQAIELAVSEMRDIKKMFASDALYIGPDGLDLDVGNHLRID